MELSICIVSFNVGEPLKACLESIDQVKGDLDVDVWVWDNASKDATVESLSPQFPHVHFIPSEENIGFAGGMNQVLKRSRGTFCLLLNPDTCLQPEALQKMMGYLKSNPQCRVVGPQLKNGDGSLQNGLRQFPDLMTVLLKETIFRKMGLGKNRIERYRMRDKNLSEWSPVDQVSGAAMMASRSHLEALNYLDEQFFIYFEEVDLCKRTVQNGFQVVYYPEAVITHWGGLSAKPVNHWVRYIHLESQMKYLKKHTSLLLFYPWLILFKILYLFSIVLELIFDGCSWLVFRLLESTSSKVYSAKKFQRRQEKVQFRLYFFSKCMLRFLMLW